MLGNSLAQIIKDYVEGRLCDLHVALPGQIIKYDHATQLADVQPQIQRKYADGTLVNLPVITNVPVVHPRTASAFIHLPIAAGDGVLLVFAERSIDEWLNKGGTVDPLDTRKHHLSDAVAIPGLFAKTNPAAPDNGDDLLLVNDQAKMSIQKGGKFKLQGSADEVIDLLIQVIDELTKVQTATLMGPQPFLPTHVLNFTTLKTKLTALKGS